MSIPTDGYGANHPNQDNTHNADPAEMERQDRFRQKQKELEERLEKNKPKRSLRHKVGLGVQAGGCVLGAGEIAGVIAYLTLNRNEYLRFLDRVEATKDAGLDIIGIGERAERDRAIIRNTENALGLDKKNDLEVQDVIRISNAGAEVVYKGNPARLKQALEQIVQFRESHAKHKETAEKMKTELEEYKANVKDIRYKINEFVNEFENLNRMGSDVLRPQLEKSGLLKKGLETMDSLMGMIQGIDINKEARENREAYLKKMTEFYDQMQSLKRVAEGMGKEYNGSREQMDGMIGQLKVVADNLDGMVAALEKGYSTAQQVEEAYGKMMPEVEKAEKQIKKVYGIEGDLTEVLKTLNDGYDTGREAHIAKGTPMEGSKQLEGRLNETGKKLDEQTTKNIQYQVPEKKFFNDVNTSPITFGIVGASIVIGVLIAGACAYLGNKIKGKAGEHYNGAKEMYDKMMNELKKPEGE
jgi:archaellum component FlaC